MRRHVISNLSALISLSLALSACGGGGGSGDSNNGPDGNACDVLGLNTRIVNGTRCEESNSPVVRLEMIFSDGSGGTCSGALITTKKIVTAAHCFVDLENSSGARAISATAVVEGVNHSIANYAVHPEAGVAADNSSAVNDVAIATLVDSVSAPTLPILLSSSPNRGDIISIFGYGIDQSGAFDGLRSGEMQVERVDNDHIFALFNGVGSNTCGGDSGGPAILQTRDSDGNELSLLVGVTSTGALANCGNGDTSLFTNLQGSVLPFLKAAAGDAQYK